MRKITNVMSIAIVFALTILATNSTFGQDDHIQQVQQTGPGPDSVLIATTPRSGLAPLQTAIGHPITNGSAPPLSQIFVNNVCVDAAGTMCESIANGQTTTANTYHGAAAYVYVWEIGYGYGEVATENGSQFSSANLVSKVPVCAANGYYTTACPNGSTIYGWRYEWNAGYYLNLGYGTLFAAQDNSINSPYNTVRTSINIQYSR